MRPWQGWLLMVLLVLIGSGCGGPAVVEPKPLTPEEERKLEEQLKKASQQEGRSKPG